MNKEYTNEEMANEMIRSLMKNKDNLLSLYHNIANQIKEIDNDIMIWQDRKYK